MILLLLQLIIEGGTAIAIFIRCFADKGGVERELVSRLYIQFPRGVLATISVISSYFINVTLQLLQMQIQFFIDLYSLKFEMPQVLLFLMTAYGTAALGQLFFFHVVLIRKVIVMVAIWLFPLLNCSVLTSTLQPHAHACTYQTFYYKEKSRHHNCYQRLTCLVIVVPRFQPPFLVNRSLRLYDPRV